MPPFLCVELHQQRTVRWMQISHTRDGFRLQELQQSPDVFIGFGRDFVLGSLGAGTLLVQAIEVNQQRVIARWLKSRYGGRRCLHIARGYNACGGGELSEGAEAA